MSILRRVVAWLWSLVIMFVRDLYDFAFPPDTPSSTQSEGFPVVIKDDVRP
jgi:hypothetical protein